MEAERLKLKGWSCCEMKLKQLIGCVLLLRLNNTGANCVAFFCWTSGRLISPMLKLCAAAGVSTLMNRLQKNSCMIFICWLHGSEGETVLGLSNTSFSSTH